MTTTTDKLIEALRACYRQAYDEQPAANLRGAIISITSKALAEYEAQRTDGAA